MPKNSGVRAVPETVPVSAVIPETTSSLRGELPGTSRLTIAHVLPSIVFPMIGCLLALASDMPIVDIVDIFLFLAGCGGIGAAVTLAVTGGRRMVLAIAHGVVAATSGK